LTTRAPVLFRLGLSLFVAATPAHAAPSRVFVSGRGANGAACGAADAPCRTLQYAHDLVAAGGEILVIDSGNFGAIKITKAVSLVRDGCGVALVSRASAGAAITIGAGPSDRVVLRGLTVEGGNVATYGLVVATAASVDVTDCVFRNFTADGVHMNVTSGPFQFTASRIEATDNGVNGMFVSGADRIDGKIVGSRFNRNVRAGLQALNYRANAQTGVLTDIYVLGGEAHANAYGYRVESTVATSPAQFVLEDASASKNSSAGVLAAGTIREARLLRNVIAHNAVGVRGVKLSTMKNNVFAGNGTDVGGTLDAAATF
jgi:hypothetical protein